MRKYRRKFSALVIYIFVIGALLVAPSFSFAQNVNQQFFVNPEFDISGRQEVASTLRHTSLRSYIFVENDYYNTLAPNQRNNLSTQLASLANEFDNNIYTKLRNRYGSEYIPGVDGDNRITILLTQLSENYGGYVNTVDTNQREMMYIQAEKIFSNLAKSLVAHEFVHLITNYQKDILRGATEEVWLAEAIAEYAPTFLGYNSVFEGSYLEERVNKFLTYPSDSLLEWRGTTLDAAAVSLFIHYVVDTYGSGVLRDILATPNTGIEALETALAQAGFAGTFEEVFTNWTLANYINGPTLNSEDLYSYKSSALGYSNFHVSSGITSSVFASSPSSLTISVKPWEGHWYKFIPGELGRTNQNVLKIDFSTPAVGPLAQFKIPYVLSDISGKRSIEYIYITDGRGSAYIPDFGTQALSVAVAPSNQAAISDNFYPFIPFTISTSFVNEVPVGAVAYPDGSLLRARGDAKVYVIKGDTKRWIQSPEIFNGYGHLRWSDIIEVASEVLAEYTESFLVREAADSKVYKVTVNGIKQWLNITPARFDASGRKWNAIYEINKNELQWYRTGGSIFS